MILRPLRKFNLSLWIINRGFNLIEFSNNTGTVSSANPNIPYINNLFEIHFNVWRCTNFSTKVQFSVQFSQNKKFRHLYYLPTGIFIYDSLLYHSLLCCIFNKITVHDKNFFTFIKYTHYYIGRYKRYLLSRVIIIAIIQNIIQRK